MRSSTSVLAGRARMLSALFMCAAALLAVRLYFVQIVHGEDYQKSARGQYVEVSSERQGRGDIFFSKKEGDLVAAAVMQSGWGLAIVPAEITDPEQVFETLSSIVPLDKERFFANAAKLGDPYEDVGFRLSDSAAARIRKEKIPGVILAPDQWRSYPADVLAAHAIGFVGYKGDAKVGVYGLEARYEDSLVKTSGLYVNPFAEIFANVGAALSSDPALNKGSVITSIEPQVQARLEETLSGVLKTYSPKEAAGIDVGAITPKTTYNNKGCIEKSGKKICNYDGKARGVVPIQEVLNQSLNLGVSFVADTMGHNVFSEYIHAFGLGEKTGIDLPNEARGIIYAIDRGYDVDYASASFGQGIAMTSIETIRALASLANGGVLPSPHVVRGIKLESGIVRDVVPPPGPRVLKIETVQTVSDMLVKVFDKALLGGILKQEHYSIAAKTGTAQIAIPGGGGYYEDRFLHSFFGYFPAHDPKFIVFLVAVEPHGAEFASATLARPFLDIAKYLINYYDIPPDR